MQGMQAENLHAEASIVDGTLSLDKTRLRQAGSTYDIQGQCRLWPPATTLASHASHEPPLPWEHLPAAIMGAPQKQRNNHSEPSDASSSRTAHTEPNLLEASKQLEASRSSASLEKNAQGNATGADERATLMRSKEEVNVDHPKPLAVTQPEAVIVSGGGEGRPPVATEAEDADRATPAQHTPQEASLQKLKGQEERPVSEVEIDIDFEIAEDESSDGAANESGLWGVVSGPNAGKYTVTATPPTNEPQTAADRDHATKASATSVIDAETAARVSEPDLGTHGGHATTTHESSSSAQQDLDHSNALGVPSTPAQKTRLSDEAEGLWSQRENGKVVSGGGASTLDDSVLLSRQPADVSTGVSTDAGARAPMFPGTRRANRIQRMQRSSRQHVATGGVTQPQAVKPQEDTGSHPATTVDSVQQAAAVAPVDDVSSVAQHAQHDEQWDSSGRGTVETAAMHAQHATVSMSARADDSVSAAVPPIASSEVTPVDTPLVATSTPQPLLGNTNAPESSSDPADSPLQRNALVAPAANTAAAATAGDVPQESVRNIETVAEEANTTERSATDTLDSARAESVAADSDATWWIKVSADAQLQDILPAAEIMRRQSARASSAAAATGVSSTDSSGNALQQPLDEIMGFQGVLGEDEDGLQRGGFAGEFAARADSIRAEFARMVDDELGSDSAGRPPQPEEAYLAKRIAEKSWFIGDSCGVDMHAGRGGGATKGGDAYATGLPGLSAITGRVRGAVEACGGGAGATSVKIGLRGSEWLWGPVLLDEVVVDSSLDGKKGLVVEQFDVKV